MQKRFSSNGCEYLAVQVPENSVFNIYNYVLYSETDTERFLIEEDLPIGYQYEEIGLAKDLTDVQLYKLTPHIDFESLDIPEIEGNDNYMFWDYINNDYLFCDITDSLESLIKSLGMTLETCLILKMVKK